MKKMIIAIVVFLWATIAQTCPNNELCPFCGFLSYLHPRMENGKLICVYECVKGHMYIK